MADEPEAVLVVGRSRVPSRSRLAGVWAAIRLVAVSLGCTACVAVSVAGCGSTALGTPAAAPASATTASDSGCAEALHAVSTYGPTVVRNAVDGEKTLDKVEINLIVFALDAAADVAGAPAAKQSIKDLANAYSHFRDAWTGAAAPSAEAILADTSHLESVCGS
jgi:hypothetical protein